MKDCVFCKIGEEERILCENDLAMAFYDIYPVNRGHTLVVPKRHMAGYFDATLEELAAINRLIFEVKDLLEKKYKPDGYNIGINVGEAGGQTVFHLHFHVIPRYKGDIEDPRGGVRKVKRSLKKYLWELT